MPILSFVLVHSLPNRLAVWAHDLAPFGFHQFLNIGGHRNVVERFCSFGAIGVCPSEELKRFASGGSVRDLFRHQDEGRSRDRPGVRAGLIRDDEIKAVAVLPIGVGSGSLNGFAVSCDGLAVLIHHLCGGELVLFGVGGLNIADRILSLLNVVGDAFIALRANAGHSTEVADPTFDFQSGLILSR